MMMQAHFAPIDIALLAAYGAVTIAVGFWRRRRTTDDYLISSRNLGLPVFVATLVATWYGGILGVGEMTYRYGLVNWTTQGLPYYVMATVFALTLAPKVRGATLYTIPDKLAEAHGRPTALLGAACAFLLATPAPYVLMVGQLVAVVTGWSLLASIVAGLLFSVAYVYVGGFQADVRINVFQFALMFLGFALALPVIVTKTGGWSWLTAQLPPEHVRIDGGLGPGYIAVWFFIALWTVVDPGFHQRCYAARTPTTARNGILIAVLCWVVFDLLTTGTGLYARAALPGLSDASAVQAYPLVAERLLPSGIKGLFYIAMLATVMSTVVSYTFIAAMTIGRDLLWRMRADASVDAVPALTRIGIVATSALAVGIALTVPSVVKQWWAIGTTCVPGLLLPVLTAYGSRRRLPPTWTFLTMLSGSGVAAACLLTAWLRHGISAEMSDSSLFPLGMQPMYLGLAASFGVYVVGAAVQRLGANRRAWTGG